jgi:hypothetical protein
VGAFVEEEAKQQGRNDLRRKARKDRRQVEGGGGSRRIRGELGERPMKEPNMTRQSL